MVALKFVGFSAVAFVLVALVTVVTSQCDETNTNCCNFAFTGLGGIGAEETQACFFNKSTNALVSNSVTILGSLILNGVLSLECYCQTNCNPSQIVCKNVLGNWATVAMYELTNWNVYCYCPDSGASCQSAWTYGSGSPDDCCPDGPC